MGSIPEHDQALPPTSPQAMKGHQSGQRAMQRAVDGDREWFQRHPESVIRFRRERKGEFQPLEAMGESVPTFIPEGFKESAPLQWVAIVDLLRLVKDDNPMPGEAVRARLRTVPVRSKQHRLQVSRELSKAIAKELLSMIETQPIASESTPINRPAA